MTDLNSQIKIEAESLCKVIREYFPSSWATGDSIPDDKGILAITYRLEQLLKEDHEK